MPRARCALAMTHCKGYGGGPVRGDVGIGPYGCMTRGAVQIRRGVRSRRLR